MIAEETKTNNEITRKRSQRYIGMQVGECPYCGSRPQMVLRFDYYTEPQRVRSEYTEWQEVQADIRCPKCGARGPIKNRKDYADWEMNKNPLGEHAAFSWGNISYSRGRSFCTLTQSDIIIKE